MKKSKPTLEEIEAHSGYKFVPLNIEFCATNINNTWERYKKNELPLNRYGKNSFCKFRVSRDTDGDIKTLLMNGVYLFVVEDEVKYLGKTTQTFKKRFGGTGYGSISPRNCFVGGQSTNCKLNAKMNEWCNQKLDVKIYTTNNVFSSNGEIAKLELKLLNLFDFELNKQHN